MLNGDISNYVEEIVGFRFDDFLVTVTRERSLLIAQTRRRFSKRITRRKPQRRIRLPNQPTIQLQPRLLLPPLKLFPFHQRLPQLPDSPLNVGTF